MVGERGPFRHGPEDVSGAEDGMVVVLLQRVASRNDEHRHIFREGLRHAGEGVLNTRPLLDNEYAILAPAHHTCEPVGDADADALLPTENGTDVDLGRRIDQWVARIAGEKLRAFPPEDFCDDISPVHACLQIP